SGAVCVPGGGGRDAYAGDPAVRGAPLSVCGGSQSSLATSPDGGSAELCPGGGLAVSDTAGADARDRLRAPDGDRVGPLHSPPVSGTPALPGAQYNDAHPRAGGRVEEGGPPV